MPQTGHYLSGLLMFCVAYAFRIGLASFLQQAAISRQRAASIQQAALPVVSLLPEGGYYRKTSF
ncbi:MAG TPA: hypothetical protein VGJ56_04835 [Reyranella sp.]|jgi:hypothetical protein